MFTWGDTVLEVIYDTYKPPHADAGLVKIKLLPEAVDPNTICEVKQQFGRGFKVVSFTGRISQDGYDDLLEAWWAQTAKTFSGPNEVSLYCTIQSLSEPRHKGRKVYYDIVLVEEEV